MKKFIVLALALFSISSFAELQFSCRGSNSTEEVIVRPYRGTESANFEFISSKTGQRLLKTQRTIIGYAAYVYSGHVTNLVFAGGGSMGFNFSLPVYGKVGNISFISSSFTGGSSEESFELECVTAQNNF